MRLNLSIPLGCGLFALACLPATANEAGIASHYADLSVTASGRAYQATDLVAAHRTLPFGTTVRVECAKSGKSVMVTIVDRGPFIAGRVIDLSEGAAKQLGFSGLRQVTLTVTR